jgi:hypothetical protein
VALCLWSAGHAQAQTAGVQVTQNAAVITSVGPAIVSPGSSIDIQGTGFSGTWFTTATVLFNGVPATSFTVISPTEIIAVLPTLPAGYVDATLTLSNGNGSVDGPAVVDPWNTGPPASPQPTRSPSPPATGITAAPQPTAPPRPAPMPPVTITGIQPDAAPAGTTLTVVGTGFSGPGYTVSGVTIGGVPAAFSVISPNQLQVVVPGIAPGATSVVVTTSNGTTTASSQPYPFTVTAGVSTEPAPPTITGFSPPVAAPGDPVTVIISGSADAPPVTTVLLGGAPVDYTIDSSGRITIIIPAGFPPGPVAVTVVFRGGGHTVTAPGVGLTISGGSSLNPPPPAPPAASGSGSFIDWLTHPTSLIQLLLELLSMIVLLGALIALLIVLVGRRRRQRQTAPSVVF